MKKHFLILLLLSSFLLPGCYLGGKLLDPWIDPLVDRYGGQILGAGKKLAGKAFTGTTDVAHDAFGTGLGGYDIVVLLVYGRFMKGSDKYQSEFQNVTLYFSNRTSKACFDASPKHFMQRLLFYGNAMDTLKLSEDATSAVFSQETCLRTSNGFVVFFSNQVEQIEARKSWSSDAQYLLKKLSLWYTRAEDPTGIPEHEREAVFKPTFLKPWDIARIDFLLEWDFYQKAPEYAKEFQFP